MLIQKSDDDFLLKGTRLVIPASLRKHELTDLHASHRDIKGTKARAGFIVYWPGIDHNITNTCKNFSQRGFDRPSNAKELMQHLPTATHAFYIISANWFDVNDEKFLVTID